MKRRFALFFVLLLFIGCSNPKDYKVPPEVDTWESNQGFKDAIKKLSAEDQKIFADYAVRAAYESAFGNDELKKGITIGEAIEIQKKWVEGQKKENNSGGGAGHTNTP